MCGPFLGQITKIFLNFFPEKLFMWVTCCVEVCEWVYKELEN